MNYELGITKDDAYMSVGAVADVEDRPKVKVEITQEAVVQSLRWAAIVFIASSVFSQCVSGAIVLDFEEFATPQTFYNPQSSVFTSQGFTFDSGDDVISIVADDQPNVPDSGSQILVMEGGANPSFILRATNNAAFSLASVFAAEGRNTTTGFFEFSATSIDVVGTLQAGGTVSTTLTLDLVAAENDTIDFQLFSFAGFEHLQSVTFTGVGGPWSGYSFALDNLNVSLDSSNAAVPEPASLAIWGLGALGGVVAGCRRRRACRAGRLA